MSKAPKLISLKEHNLVQLLQRASETRLESVESLLLEERADLEEALQRAREAEKQGGVEEGSVDQVQGLVSAIQHRIVEGVKSMQSVMLTAEKLPETAFIPQVLRSGERIQVRKSTGAKGSSPWRQYTDENGQPYYHNTITNVTQWEPPEDQKPEKKKEFMGRPAARTEANASMLCSDLPLAPLQPDESHKANALRKSVPASVSDTSSLKPQLPAGWTQHSYDDGRKYYFNEKTKISTWEFPKTAAT